MIDDVYTKNHIGLEETLAALKRAETVRISCWTTIRGIYHPKITKIEAKRLLTIMNGDGCPIASRSVIVYHSEHLFIDMK